MKKLCLVCFIAAAMGLLLPLWGDSLAVFAAGGGDQPTKEGGALQPSKTQVETLAAPEDDPVGATGRDYNQAVASLAARLASVDDPAEREKLQHEIQALKLEGEIAVKETMLLVATDQKDTERIAELEKALDAMYQVVKAKPADEGAAQPEGGAPVTQVRQRQPDDAPEGGTP